MSGGNEFSPVVLGEDFNRYLSLYNPLVVLFWKDQFLFIYFCRWSPSKHPCTIVFNSDHLFQRKCEKFPMEVY